MEGLTRLVSESLARYGLDRPLDYRRLQWSRWFRCESLHSLLHVPSKPGIFALAEEVMDLGNAHVETAALDKVPVGTAALGCPGDHDACSDARAATDREGHNFSRATDAAPIPASAAEGQRRMLSVLQFHEDDDMAYVLDRMLSRHNPMSRTLASGRCFVRFVVVDDAIQRRSICNALNQWLVSTAETVTGIGAHFATSLEFTVGQQNVGRTLPSTGSGQALSAAANTTKQPAQPQVSEVKSVSQPDSSAAQASPLDSGFATNIHCPHPLPSGF
jgi:hypothetical protein